MKRLAATLAVVMMLVGSSASAFDPADLKKLRETNQCVSCDLFKADLFNDELTNANLNGAKLTDAKLSYANLIGADLTCTNLSHANVVILTLPKPI